MTREYDASPDAKRRIDPFMVAVLKSRFEAIVREMSLVVMRASRSAVIKNARDFSCAILTFEHELVTVEDALPIHVMSMDMATRPLTDHFDDIEDGDIFINNCPYTGGTHHADLIMAMPVFIEGTPRFWAVALSHHADTGAPAPSTYLPFAKNIFEEGMHFPCVRLVRKGEVRDDILRIGTMRNRVPDLWLGDVHAQLGACRTGARRIEELCTRYSEQTVLDFIADWFDYGARRAAAAISALPKGTYSYSIKHDPVPGVADDGIPVNVAVHVDPEAGEIIVDARDNIDCVEGGLNLSANTATGSCRIGVFNNLDASIPHNEGAKSRVKVRLRKGCVVGEPSYPVGTSVATTNVNDRLMIAGNAVFSEMGAPYGQAESGSHLPAGVGVISGADPFKGGKTYVNQVFVGYAAGGANHGHDGWLTYCGAANAGLIQLDSVEVDESMYPILIEERGVLQDSQGAGEFEGAPAMYGLFRPIGHDMTIAYAADGTTFPPRGVLGGGDGKASLTRRIDADGSTEDLPAFAEEIIPDGSKLYFTACAGAGYGPPSRRDPQRVADTVNRGWLSQARATQDYGVAFEDGAEPGVLQVDETATDAMRKSASEKARP
ncbi:hydantoinase B/oxoprolinase family protein [Ruegeria sp. 2012CJ41-6]|uniref:Hydantoinase B/oxoprolinase family protein n=1 Tax=Ruegeria spongiae TaxID=2942209 RepID=A0ABT0Q3Z4_9RHOB|nr:hydantoinase B/oxoprolinase family protein [Ruegeria spongiae]MCL6284162.1 hydantoinase B/oxoprolinase family protein [Ruegeria spongiae]